MALLVQNRVAQPRGFPDIKTTRPFLYAGLVSATSTPVFPWISISITLIFKRFEFNSHIQDQNWKGGFESHILLQKGDAYESVKKLQLVVARDME